MKHWCKLQTKALNDHRLLKLPSDAQLTYYKLMHVAAQCDAFGALVDDDSTPLDYDALGIYLRQDPKACEMNIAALMRTGLITLDASGAFNVTDYSSERDETAIERKREQRKRDKAVTGDINLNSHADVTEVSRRCHENVTPIEKEKEEEKEVFAQSANPLQQKQKTKTQREQDPRGDLFVAVASLCKIPTDDKRSARAINAAAEWLLNKGQTPERLNEFLSWWNTNDWRGKKGDPPKPNEIVTEWLKFEAGPKQQQTNGSKPTAQMPKNKMMLNGVEVYI
jgi:hypothetical protein